MPNKVEVFLIANDTGLVKTVDNSKLYLAKFTGDIEKINPKFAPQINKQFDEIEAGAKKTKNSVKDAFSSFGSIVGVGAAFGIATKFLVDSTKAAFEAEKANRKLSASATEAGLAYQDLAAKAAKFSKEGGLSQTEGADLTSRITQLAANAGRPQDIEKLQKSFLDLSAARGIGSGEINDLIGTILSGQDEGLNRLGLSDPSKLQAQYAKSLGKTVEQLSQMEKTQAAVNAVMDKAQLFTGANADKMNSLSGKTEQANAKLQDLYTGFGQGITQTMEFRSALVFANNILESMTTNVVTLQNKLSKGISPKELAKQEANKPFNQMKDALNDFSSGILALNPSVIISDLITEGAEGAFSKLNEALTGSRKRREKFFEEAFEGERKLLEKQNSQAKEQAANLANKGFADSFQARTDALIKGSQDSLQKVRIQVGEADKLERELKANRSKLSDSEFETAQKNISLVRNKFYSERAEDASKRFDRNPNLEDAKFNLKALESIKKFLPEEQFESFQDKLQDFIKNDLEKTNSKILDLKKTTIGFLENLNDKSGANNPFVSIYSEADKAMQTLRDSTKGLSQDLKDQIELLQKQQNSNSLFSARLDNDLNAFNLREDAKELRNFSPKTPEIKDTAKFFEDFIEAGLKQIAAKNGGSLQPQINASLTADGKGFLGFSQSQNSPFTRFHSNIFTGADGKQYTNGFSQSDARNDFLNVYEKVGTGGSYSRQRTFADLTESDKAKYLKSLEKVDDSSSVQQRIEKQLLITQNSNPKNIEQQSLADQKIIALTQGLKPEQMTERIRDAAAASREREADRAAKAEKIAEEDRRNRNEFYKKVGDALEKGFKLDKDSVPPINVSVKTSGNGKSVEAGVVAAPSPQTTKSFFDEYQQQ